jgi:hypothetical protein
LSTVTFSKNKQTAKSIQPNDRKVSLHHKFATFQERPRNSWNNLPNLRQAIGHQVKALTTGGNFFALNFHPKKGKGKIVCGLCTLSKLG